MNKLKTIFDVILDITAYFGAGLIVFAFAIITLSVLLRFLFNISILWPTEVTEYILAAVTFVCAAWVLKKGRHIFLDTGLEFLSGRGQAIVNTITSLLGAVLSFLLFYFGIVSTWDHFLRGTHQTVKIMDLPTAPLLTVIPIGFFFLTIEFLRRGYDNFRKARVSTEKKAKTIADLSEL